MADYSSIQFSQRSSEGSENSRHNTNNNNNSRTHNSNHSAGSGPLLQDSSRRWIGSSFPNSATNRSTNNNNNNENSTVFNKSNASDRFVNALSLLRHPADDEEEEEANSNDHEDELRAIHRTKSVGESSVNASNKNSNMNNASNAQSVKSLDFFVEETKSKTTRNATSEEDEEDIETEKVDGNGESNAQAQVRPNSSSSPQYHGVVEVLKSSERQSEVQTKQQELPPQEGDEDEVEDDSFCLYSPVQKKNLAPRLDSKLAAPNRPSADPSRGGPDSPPPLSPSPPPKSMNNSNSNNNNSGPGGGKSKLGNSIERYLDDLAEEGHKRIFSVSVQHDDPHSEFFMSPVLNLMDNNAQGIPGYGNIQGPNLHNNSGGKVNSNNNTNDNVFSVSETTAPTAFRKTLRNSKSINDNYTPSENSMSLGKNANSAYVVPSPRQINAIRANSMSKNNNDDQNSNDNNEKGQSSPLPSFQPLIHTYKGSGETGGQATAAGRNFPQPPTVSVGHLKKILTAPPPGVKITKIMNVPNNVNTNNNNRNNNNNSSNNKDNDGDIRRRRTDDFVHEGTSLASSEFGENNEDAGGAGWPFHQHLPSLRRGNLKRKSNGGEEGRSGAHEHRRKSNSARSQNGNDESPAEGARRRSSFLNIFINLFGKNEDETSASGNENSARSNSNRKNKRKRSSVNPVVFFRNLFSKKRKRSSVFNQEKNKKGKDEGADRRNSNAKGNDPRKKDSNEVSGRKPRDSGRGANTNSTSVSGLNANSGIRRNYDNNNSINKTDIPIPVQSALRNIKAKGAGNNPSAVAAAAAPGGGPGNRKSVGFENSSSESDDDSFHVGDHQNTKIYTGDDKKIRKSVKKELQNELFKNFSFPRDDSGEQVNHMASNTSNPNRGTITTTDTTAMAGKLAPESKAASVVNNFSFPASSVQWEVEDRGVDEEDEEEGPHQAEAENITQEHKDEKEEKTKSEDDEGKQNKKRKHKRRKHKHRHSRRHHSSRKSNQPKKDTDEEVEESSDETEDGEDSDKPKNLIDVIDVNGDDGDPHVRRELRFNSDSNSAKQLKHQANENGGEDPHREMLDEDNPFRDHMYNNVDYSNRRAKDFPKHELPKNFKYLTNAQKTFILKEIEKKELLDKRRALMEESRLAVLDRQARKNKNKNKNNNKKQEKNKEEFKEMLQKISEEQAKSPRDTRELSKLTTDASNREVTKDSNAHAKQKKLFKEALANYRKEKEQFLKYSRNNTLKNEADDRKMKLFSEKEKILQNELAKIEKQLVRQRNRQCMREHSLLENKNNRSNGGKPIKNSSTVNDEDSSSWVIPTATHKNSSGVITLRSLSDQSRLPNENNAKTEKNHANPHENDPVPERNVQLYSKNRTTYADLYIKQLYMLQQGPAEGDSSTGALQSDVFSLISSFHHPNNTQHSQVVFSPAPRKPQDDSYQQYSSSSSEPHNYYYEDYHNSLERNIFASPNVSCNENNKANISIQDSIQLYKYQNGTGPKKIFSQPIRKRTDNGKIAQQKKEVDLYYKKLIQITQRNLNYHVFSSGEDEYKDETNDLDVFNTMVHKKFISFIDDSARIFTRGHLKNEQPSQDSSLAPHNSINSSKQKGKFNEQLYAPPKGHRTYEKKEFGSTKELDEKEEREKEIGERKKIIHQNFVKLFSDFFKTFAELEMNYRYKILLEENTDFHYTLCRNFNEEVYIILEKEEEQEREKQKQREEDEQRRKAELNESENKVHQQKEVDDRDNKESNSSSTSEIPFCVAGVDDRSLDESTDSDVPQLHDRGDTMAAENSESSVLKVDRTASSSGYEVKEKGPLELSSSADEAASNQRRLQEEKERAAIESEQEDASTKETKTTESEEANYQELKHATPEASTASISGAEAEERKEKKDLAESSRNVENKEQAEKGETETKRSTPDDNSIVDHGTNSTSITDNNKSEEVPKSPNHVTPSYADADVGPETVNVEATTANAEPVSTDKANENEEEGEKKIAKESKESSAASSDDSSEAAFKIESDTESGDVNNQKQDPSSAQAGETSEEKPDEKKTEKNENEETPKEEVENVLPLEAKEEMKPEDPFSAPSSPKTDGKLSDRTDSSVAVATSSEPKENKEKGEKIADEEVLPQVREEQNEATDANKTSGSNEPTTANEASPDTFSISQNGDSERRNSKTNKRVQFQLEKASTIKEDETTETPQEQSASVADAKEEGNGKDTDALPVAEEIEHNEDTTIAAPSNNESGEAEMETPPAQTTSIDATDEEPQHTTPPPLSVDSLTELPVRSNTNDSEGVPDHRKGNEVEVSADEDLRAQLELLEKLNGLDALLLTRFPATFEKGIDPNSGLPTATPRKKHHDSAFNTPEPFRRQSGTKEDSSNHEQALKGRKSSASRENEEIRRVSAIGDEIRAKYKHLLPSNDAEKDTADNSRANSSSKPFRYRDYSLTDFDYITQPSLLEETVPPSAFTPSATNKADHYGNAAAVASYLNNGSGTRELSSRLSYLEHRSSLLSDLSSSPSTKNIGRTKNKFWEDNDENEWFADTSH